MERNSIISGERYRDYKGNIYEIKALAKNVETEEEMVVYQELRGDLKCFVISLTGFWESVKNYDGRFVPRFTREDAKALEEKEKERERQIIEGVNPLLMDFLDAEGSREKLEVLRLMKKTIDDKTVSDIAAALDIVIEDKSLEERVNDIENCLITRARFETVRLRGD